MSKKEDTLIALFKAYKKNKKHTFNNDLVKDVAKKTGFKNPFDTTHIDNIKKLPSIYIENDVFIVHLGEGNHAFFKGIKNAYHKFEEVKEKTIWNYKPGVVDELNNSESNILSLAYNQEIISDFLYDKKINPKVYNSHRTKYSFEYKIGKEKIKTTKQQIEIDMTVEHDGRIGIFEAKNNFPEDFAIYQIYLPFLYYLRKKKELNLKIKNVKCYYLLKKVVKNEETKKNETKIRIYEYKFNDPYNMATIELVKSKEYTINKI